MDLLEVADRLYALPPDSFMDARAEEGKQAKDDRDLAAAIKAMRKPSTAAGLLNAFVREQSDDVDQLIALGNALREAQLALDGDELRTLTRQRRQLISSLTAAAGKTATDPVNREISSTFEAAVVDELAAAALRSGRLIKSLTATGVDAVELDGLVAVPDQLPEIKRTRLRALKRAPVTPKQTSTVAQKAADQLAEKAALAERALVKADSALASMTAKTDQARTRVQDAESELQQARSALASVEKNRASAKRERDAAKRARDSAQQAVRKAQNAKQGR